MTSEREKEIREYNDQDSRAHNMKVDLLAEIDKLREKLEIAMQALEQIPVPSSTEISGKSDLEKFKKLYDFWHYVDVKKFNTVQKALSKIKGDQPNEEK